MVWMERSGCGVGGFKDYLFNFLFKKDLRNLIIHPLSPIITHFLSSLSLPPIHFHEYILIPPNTATHHQTTRLLKYDPILNLVTIAAPNLAFPNGLLLSRFQDYIFIAETSRARITKYILWGGPEIVD